MSNELVIIAILLIVYVGFWIWRLGDADFRQRAAATELTLVIAAMAAIAVGLRFDNLRWLVLLPALTTTAVMAIRLFEVIARGYRISNHDVDGADPSVPTVTYAIPARNEDAVLKNALTVALRTTYPKVDFIALDDCSFDQTPNVIRSFAHEGFRFVQSRDSAVDTMEESLSVLVDHALGDYIVFAGVDLELKPDALTHALAYMRSRKLDMLSIIPSKKPGDKLAYVFEPPRYFLQAISPHPGAYAHTLWIADVSLLRKYIETQEKPRVMYDDLVQKARQFELVLPSAMSGFHVRKRTRSQWRSSLRDASLTQGRNVGPAIGWLASIGFSFVTTPAAAVGVLLAMTSIYAIWSVVSRPSYLMLAPLNAVINIACFAPLTVISAGMRRLGLLSWKGRNVCYPPKLYRDEYKVKR